MNIHDHFDDPKELSPGVYEVPCPVHDDSHPSLVIWTKPDGGEPTVHCRAGCDWREIKDRLGWSTKGQSASPPPGCTIEEYAAARRLPGDELRRWGLETVSRKGVKAVAIPYKNASGSELARQYRVSLTGENRIQWGSGAQKPAMYGMWRMDKLGDSVVIVEGPSDCHTLWHYGIPALALTDAASWGDTVEHHLEGFSDIVVLIEPDKGGETVLKSVLGSRHIDRIRVGYYQSVAGDDASSIHMTHRGPESTLKALIDGAEPAAPIRDAADAKRIEAAFQASRRISEHPQVLDLVDETFKQLGLVGEDANAKIIYLAITSRLLDNPVSIAVKGVSSAGKSYTSDMTVGLFPESAVVTFTGASERALIFSDEEYQHRMIYMVEASGLVSEFQDYMIRTLLSEGRIVYEVTVRGDDGQFGTQKIEKLGPTGLLVATTRTHLHPENETRLWSLAADESDSQTEAVMSSIAMNHAGESHDAEQISRLTGTWHQYQEWLQLTGPHEVIVPFAPAIASNIPPRAVRLRRDFSLLMGTIQAHALLHKLSRGVDAQGRIVATVDDYRIVHALVHELVAEGVEATVPEAVRETVHGAVEAGARRRGTEQKHDDHAGSVTAKQVHQQLEVSDISAVRRRITRAVESGFLERPATKKGQAMRIWLADDLPDDVPLLPDPDLIDQVVSGGNGSPEILDLIGPSDPVEHLEVVHTGSPIEGDTEPTHPREGDER